MMSVARSARKHAGRRVEIFGVALVAAGVLLTLALFSYDPERVAGGSRVTQERNLAGLLGAYVSYYLIGAIGVSAYALPPLLMFCALRRFRSRLSDKLPQLAYGVATMFCVSVLAALTDAVPRPPSHAGRGGMVGAMVADALVRQLNLAGASVVLIGATTVGLLLTTDLSLHLLWARARNALSRRGSAAGADTYPRVIDVEHPKGDSERPGLPGVTPATDGGELLETGPDEEAPFEPATIEEASAVDDVDEPLIVRKTAAVG